MGPKRVELLHLLRQKRDLLNSMIQILNDLDCCGCSACIQVCPVQCISFVENERGFLYPTIESSDCVQCRLCEKVCPIINKLEPREPLQIFACVNKDEHLRYRSSSGGIFVLLSELVIKSGGVVFGAKFDSNWMVIHSFTDSISGLSDFLGSKYVQSRIGETYKQAETFLKEGRKVLFSGTPCQISGLHHYLRSDYPNLLTVEVICHGVPSPRIWRDYLNVLYPSGSRRGSDSVLSSRNDISTIKGISFRDKQNGWKKYSFLAFFSDEQVKSDEYGLSSVTEGRVFRQFHRDNLYMQAFLNNLSLRPTCFDCPAKNARSRADVSLGDFWTIKDFIDAFDDDKGVTLVYINSDKGLDSFNSIDCKSIELKKGVVYNRMFAESAHIKYPLDEFWNEYDKEGLLCVKRIVKSIRPSLIKRIVNKVKIMFK